MSIVSSIRPRWQEIVEGKVWRRQVVLREQLPESAAYAYRTGAYIKLRSVPPVGGQLRFAWEVQFMEGWFTRDQPMPFAAKKGNLKRVERGRAASWDDAEQATEALIAETSAALLLGWEWNETKLSKR